ncbi:50S ribosomal protein L2 [Candidatus Pacearchaeota archaeon]|nr:MAG: 50S ribosomal protein L2 [Candidatus Pacearchaeota archaeon]
MGKRIIQQRRGRGTNTYKVNKKAFRYRIKYPKKLEGEGKVIKLINSLAHTCPIAKIKYNKSFFYMPSFKGMFEGQTIKFGGKEIEQGNILKLKDIPVKTKIYNIESRPGDGGKFIRGAGNYAEISKAMGGDIFVIFPSKKEKKFNPDCRATIGVVAGSGRLEKPIMKAGKQYYIKKTKNKLWPRTSAVKMNAIDHPFGSGRSKNPKSKIAKRNAPPGRKVGLLRPKRTGKRK